MPKHIHPLPFILYPPADLVTRQPELRRWSAQLSLKFASGLAVTDDELKAIGGALWEALGAEEKFEAARKEAGNAILPIVIESETAEVQALPWEILHHPALGFLGRLPAFTLTRRLAAPAGSPPPLQKGPLRVLLFTSLPEDLHPEQGRLNVEEEQARVQDALLPGIAAGRVTLEMPDDGRFETFKALLRDFDPHLVFLSGHGRFYGEAHREEKFGVFLFEDEAGEGLEVREEKLAEAFVGSSVQAVILSACESGKAASDLLNNGLTRRLSAQGIPHVIGMRESVQDEAGILFARALCDELARAEGLACALQAARLAIPTAQWNLPLLFAPRPAAPLIDWDFAPQPVDAHRRYVEKLGNLSLPPRFVGRRAELRRWQYRLRRGSLRQLLITGPGGQGKTSLAGKLALDLQKEGWKIFAWSIRPENRWKDFEFELELALDEGRAKRFNQYRLRFETDAQRARFLLDLLVEQFDGRLLLLLDNLESVQDGQSLAVTDPAIAAWLEAALPSLPGRGEGGEGQHSSPAGRGEIAVLVTSRWAPPGWRGERLELGRVTYGDFLQIARRLPAAFWQHRERMRRAYAALGGNPRGLEFLPAAVQEMNPAEEEAFLAALEKAKEEMQTNMTLEAIYARLPAAAQTLLRRLPAYHEPVPLEGILKLGMELPNPAALFERLLAVSLLEVSRQPAWEALEYALPPLASDWLETKKWADDSLEWKRAAADYHLYLHRYERRTLEQAILTHHALRRAERHPEADRLTLDFIVYPLTLAGSYTALLTDWLPRICESQDLQTRAAALGQTGKLHLHLGNFQQALPYFEQSLAICQQIGDKAGEGVTLNNLSQIYHAQGDTETALSYLKQSLAICQQIGDRAGEGVTLNNLSQIYKAQGDTETALSCLKQSLDISQQIGDRAGEGATLTSIGNIFYAQGDYEKALGYLKQSLAICQQIGDRAGEGRTLNNLSQIYKAQGDTETALSYLKQSLAIRQQIGDKAGLCVTLFNMGHLHAQKGERQPAFSAWVRVYVIAKQINEYRVLQALANLAPRLGLPAGLAGWERLAEKMKENGSMP